MATPITPTNKVTAGLAVGAAITVIAWVSKAYFDVILPAEVQAALQALVVFGIQWSVSDAKA